MKYNSPSYTWNLGVSLQWDILWKQNIAHLRIYVISAFLGIYLHDIHRPPQTSIYFTLKREWESVCRPSGFTLLGKDWGHHLSRSQISMSMVYPDITFCSPYSLLPYFSMVFAKSKWILFSVWGLWMHSRPDGHHLSDDSVSARASPAWLTCWEHSHPLCCPFRLSRN